MEKSRVVDPQCSRRGRVSEFFVIVLLVAGAFSRAGAQTQYSIGNPTSEQQYMLELINRARANGGAEAARLGLGGLQEGPPSIVRGSGGASGIAVVEVYAVN